MGTDIHGVFQKRIANSEYGGIWEDVESTYEYTRHYFLFAWLANVRNGYGFAGIPTHTPVEPLQSERGLPLDFPVDAHKNHPLTCKAAQQANHRRLYLDHPTWLEDEYDRLRHERFVNMGDHNFGWLTADEILDGKKPTTSEKAGVIDLSHWEEWKTYRKEPRVSYSAGIMGATVLVADMMEGDVDLMVKLHANTDRPVTHVRVYWIDEDCEEIAYFIDEVRRLKELHGFVRFVFGFDS